MTEHDQQVFHRLRQKMNNKNYKQWDDHINKNTYTNHYFGNYKYEATKWHEKMLKKMHKTISLEGRPVTKAMKERSDSGSI